jgi:hypothetical protein
MSFSNHSTKNTVFHNIEIDAPRGLLGEHIRMCYFIISNGKRELKTSFSGKMKMPVTVQPNPSVIFVDNILHSHLIGWFLANSWMDWGRKL